MSDPDARASTTPPPEADPQSEEMELDDAFVRMGEIVDHLQGSAESGTKELAFELLDWVDGFHREAVVRIASMLPGDALDSLAQDPVVARLFETYLADQEEPDDLADSLEEALDEIRPYLHSHGGEMEVLGVSHGIVRLRLMGSCDGCPSSTLTLTQGVEKILQERWPGFRGIEVEGAEEPDPHQAPPKLHQIQSLRRQ